MFSSFNELLINIQADIAKKFETSKYYEKIKEIFETKFEQVREHFLICMNQTEKSKFY
jgi:hypothetical protein